MHFGLFIYPGVEPIDLAPLGVLSMAKRLEPSVSSCVVARKPGEVALSNGLRVLADVGVEDAPELDVLIIAGGPGWVSEANQQETLDFLRRRASSTLLVSICTGAMILAASGVLRGQRATTKQQVVAPEESPLAVLARRYPDIDVVSASLVDNGTTMTAGGVSLCIDATLYLLQRCYGQGLAEETARIMEYHRAWDANRSLFPAYADERIAP
jgi:transcriptional regulator GlxA family with amidase domain